MEHNITFPLVLAKGSTFWGANTQPLWVIPQGPAIVVILGSLMTNGVLSCPFLYTLGSYLQGTT